MRKRYKALIILAALLVILVFAALYANTYIKKVVAKKLTEEFNVEFQELDASIWDRTISVDSVQGFLNNGTLAQARLSQLNWYSLYMNPKVDLDDLCFSLSGLSTMTADGKYNLTVDSIHKERDKIFLQNVNLESPLSDSEFHSSLIYRQPKIDLKIPTIHITDFRADSNYVHSMEVAELILDVDEDLNNPLKGNKKKLPGEILKDLGSPVIIHEMKLANGIIRYAVIDEGSSEKAMIDFEEVRLKVTNLRSDSLPGEMIMDLDCTVAGAPLNVVTRNFLGSPTYQYDFYGELSNYDFTSLSPVTEAAKGISINSGYVNKMTMKGSFYDDRADGSLSINYRDLKVNLDNDVAGFLSFISNTAIKDSDDVEVEFSSEREQDKGHLVHVIQSLVEAMKKALLVI